MGQEKGTKEKKEITLADSDFTPKQIQTILERTPKEYIYHRPGRGKDQFDYVSIGYVIKKLNRIFGFAGWDFEVVQQEIREGHIWVLGRLTFKDNKGHTITKMQFGSAAVKFLTEPKKDEKGGFVRDANGRPMRVPTKEMVDLGDDLKAAASDALKKSAALLGIASDVYYEKEYREVPKGYFGELEPPKRDENGK